MNQAMDGNRLITNRLSLTIRITVVMVTDMLAISLAWLAGRILPHLTITDDTQLTAQILGLGLSIATLLVGNTVAVATSQKK
jgi:hypothetical protein